MFLLLTPPIPCLQRPLDLRQRKHDPYGTHGQQDAVAFHPKLRHRYPSAIHRLTSLPRGDVLKHRNGFLIRGRYETRFRCSRNIPLTLPFALV